MAQAHQPALEPVQDHGVAAATLGTVLWAVAGVVCVLMRDRLEDNGTQWWIATCLVGVALGFLGMAYTRRRAQAYRGQGGGAAGSDGAQGHAGG